MSPCRTTPAPADCLPTLESLEVLILHYCPIIQIFYKQGTDRLWTACVPISSHKNINCCFASQTNPVQIAFSISYGIEDSVAVQCLKIQPENWTVPMGLYHLSSAPMPELHAVAQLVSCMASIQKTKVWILVGFYVCDVFSRQWCTQGTTQIEVLGWSKPCTLRAMYPAVEVQWFVTVYVPVG